jgi:hypothetical protein
MKTTFLAILSLISFNSFADWSISLKSKSVVCLGADDKGTIELSYSRAKDLGRRENVADAVVKVDGKSLSFDRFNALDTQIGAYGGNGSFQERTVVLEGSNFKWITFQSFYDFDQGTKELIESKKVAKQYLMTGEVQLGDSPDHRVFKAQCKVDLHEVCLMWGDPAFPCEGNN